MSNQTIDNVSSGADRAKMVVAIAAVLAGIVGYYLLDQQPAIARVGSVLVGLLVGAGLAYTTVPGQRFFAFARDSWNETKRVIWPDRKETTQVTLIVFAFVVVMALFLWLVDKTLEFTLYDLILGWT